VNAEQLVESQLAGKSEVMGGNLPQCRFAQHKSHVPGYRTLATAIEIRRLTDRAMTPLQLRMKRFGK
jgi:hypothetical protein